MATHSSIIGKFHGQRSLAGYSSLGQRVGYDLATEYVCTDNTHLLPDIVSSFFLSNIRSSSGFENRYITFFFFYSVGSGLIEIVLTLLFPKPLQYPEYLLNLRFYGRHHNLF